MTTGARRRSWAVCGGLLIAAACFAAWSTWVNWLPCRGTMLLGTPWGGPYPGAGFSDACMERMDNGSAFPVPGDPSLPQRSATIIGLVAQVLAAAAWLLLVRAVSRPSNGRTARVTVVPSLLLVLLNSWFVLDPDQPVGLWVWLVPFAADLAAVAAFIVLCAEGAMKARVVVSTVVVLWGVSAFSAIHLLGDFLVTVSFNNEVWDAAPGTGYPTAAVLLISGLVALAGATSRQPKRADERTVAPEDSAAAASGR